ncbi:MAG: ABC transporter ATP-binding protein [Rickettsiales bacterium]|nr:ABC transporter ATP-binding protein [Rickettsiales bacterium]
MTDFAISIDNLKKTYQKSSRSPKKEALKNIDLKIKKGSFFGLLGPNGAGKSTIINIIAGLVKKTSGTIKIAGINIDENLQKTKFKIGIVPQELIIDPFFNVFETLEIYAGYYGIKKSARRTFEIIEALGLKEKAKSTPRSLSGGMRRRLLVAKALVHNPEILILDEPTAGVDVDLRNQLWDYVKKLNQEQNTTIVLTTHYLEEAQKLCDEIAVINNGTVVAQKSTAELMNILNYKQLLITSRDNFLGDINNLSNEIIAKTKNSGVGSDIIIKNTDNNFLVEYDPKNFEVEKILNIFNLHNIKIVDISTRQPDLEEVFKYLIKSNN